jgi:flavorubredoxin
MIPTLLPTSSQLIAADTWLIPTLAQVPTGEYVGAHSMVIRGAEPVIVDTGCALVRDRWMNEVFSVVAPDDVRWIYVSHDDHDHIGNLLEMLDLCRNATLIASYPIVNRLAGDVELPLDRMRWLNEGESFALSDRTITAVRPPMFDAPSTRALFDASTGVLWAVDSFGALVPGEVYERADVPDELYGASFVELNLGNTPWLSLVDREKFAAHVYASASLEPAVVASAHGPVHRGDEIADAYARTFDLVGHAPIESPGQDVLEMLLSVLEPAA